MISRCDTGFIERKVYPDSSALVAKKEALPEYISLK